MSASISPSRQIIRRDSHTQSRFWKRLEECEGKSPWDAQEVRKLKANVGEVVKQAEWIGSQVNRYLPQYTLHDKRHYLNVLGIMDGLVPQSVMDGLSPLECALYILAAFTHDLGMALSDEQYKAVKDENSTSPERRRFLSHRARFAEEVRQIERLAKEAGTSRRVELIEGHILAEYIRTTHASYKGRIGYWLDEIAKVTNNFSLFQYAGYDFRNDLELIDVSHNEDVAWLRDQMCKNGNERGFTRIVDGAEVNFGLPALLLRVADILDFDASRTPSILFRHIGIENKVSIMEWNKHLSITGWMLKDEEQPSLLYEADCAHPVHQKSVEEFARVIRNELQLSANELEIQRNRLGSSGARYACHLPLRVVVNVRPQGYIYRDVEFRLDQDEVLQLLMGESLYGDPRLCIRELLQNSLDAVKLRELRLKLPRKQRAEPTDDLVLDDGEDEPLQVELTWGTDADSGQQFIAVTDHGVGMTRKVIENYFTRIGKSFYRSPEFEQERALFSRNGHQSSPISRFGIGILSCFMIADRMEVRTRPGGCDQPNRDATNVTISGPGSLFWMQDGTLEHQGTEVKIFLKSKFKLEHNLEDFWMKLREEFYGTSSQQDQANTTFSPAFVAARHVVWPEHPVVIQVPDNDELIVLDEHFHRNFLMPLEKEMLHSKAAQWQCPPEKLGVVSWGWFDWRDDGEEGTGSRVRFYYPCNAGEEQSSPPNDVPGLCRLAELACLVEPQLSGNRNLQLVKSMFVTNANLLETNSAVVNGVGGRVWIDWRGETAPRLTADRNTALLPDEQDEEKWKMVVGAMFQRLSVSLSEKLELFHASYLLHAFSWAPHIRKQFSAMEFSSGQQKTSFSLTKAAFPSWTNSQDICLQWSRAVLDQELSKRRELSLTFGNRFDRDRELQLNLDHRLDHEFTYDRTRPRISEGIHKLARELASLFDIGFIFSFDHDFIDHSNHYSYIHSHAFHHASYRAASMSHFTIEAFRPDLSRSFAPWDLFTLRGQVAMASIQGPALIELETERDGKTIHAIDLEGHLPAPLAQRGYDLVFPLTAIPIGALRRACPTWCHDRHYRLVGSLPFLFPCKESIWQKRSAYFRELFNVDRIFALIPKFELWNTPFADWSDEDWRTCGLSALWNIPTGEVLWAEGAHHVNAMKEVGRPIEEFVEQFPQEEGW